MSSKYKHGSLQHVILMVPESCPKVALRCETKMIGMKWRIWQEKILLLLRIKKHNEEALCRQVYEEGRSRGWPGLGQEVSAICKELGIADVNEQMVSKCDVKKAIFENHYNEMVEKVKKQTKLEDIKEEDFRELQPYSDDKSVDNGRMAFRIRSQMVKDIPGNFKNMYRVRGTVKDGLTCPDCRGEEIMTQSHCLACPAWSELRQGLDITDINDLVVFFRKLLVERAKV